LNRIRFTVVAGTIAAAQDVGFINSWKLTL